MKFYLGTHMYYWIYQLDIPLFISRRRIPKQLCRDKIKARFCLDSGGFSEISMYGAWVTTPEDYLYEVFMCMRTGCLDWAAPQDWMCEPFMLEKTGKTVREHQELTIKSVIDLRVRAGKVIIPVLQGWIKEDYLDHVKMYSDNGIDLTKEWIVGVGSVCRRQGTKEANAIFTSLYELGISLHGFGVKIDGLRIYGNKLVSSDSMAWSANARRELPLVGCAHMNCANCVIYAKNWRDKIVKGLQ